MRDQDHRLAEAERDAADHLHGRRERAMLGRVFLEVDVVKVIEDD